jgi:hypothetical protein
MPNWIRWQIEGIVALQALQPPWALPLWQAITWLGEEQAFLLILAGLLWGYRKREALYAAAALLLGAYLTFVLKDLFAAPRPFQIAPDRVQVWRPGGEALGYGLTSGHALNTTAMWGTLAGRSAADPLSSSRFSSSCSSASPASSWGCISHTMWWPAGLSERLWR